MPTIISEDELLPVSVQRKSGRIITEDELLTPTGPAPSYLKRAAAASYRPALEMGGMITGGTLGTTGGPVGTAVGGVTGYMTGKNVADALDQWLGIVEPQTVSEAIREMPGELATGMAYESVGPAIKLTGKSIYKLSESLGVNNFFRGIRALFPGISDAGIIKKAKQALLDIKAGNFEKPTKETDDILNALQVKTQPTFAQRTGSAKAASFEQSASAKDAALKHLLLQQDAHINAEATKYIASMRQAGASADDVIAAVDKHNQVLQREMSAARTALERKVPVVSRIAQSIGVELRGELEAGKATAKAMVGKKYSEVPNVIVNPKPIRAALKNVVQDIKLRRGDKSTIPSGIIGQIRKTLKLKQAPTRPAGYIVSLPPRQQEVALQFEKLRAWSSQIDEEIRNATRGIQPNLNLARRLNMLKDGIVESMDDLLSKEKEFPEAVAKLKEAHKYFIESYLEPYRLGTVAEVLQKGYEVGGAKIPYSEVPARFFAAGKLDAADDLIRAVGKDRARKLIGEYAEGQFLSASKDNAGNLVTSKAETWLAKNKTILDKYGLTGHFESIIKAGKLSDVAIANAKTYEKTMASVILRSDPDKLFKELFTTRSSGRAMLDLLDLPGVKENKAAINGIKADFNRFLMREMEASGVDILGNPIRTLAKAKTVLSKYSPAIRILYKDDPKQAEAFFNYHKLLDILARNKTVTYSQGSTTAEKLMSSKTVIHDLFDKAAQMAAVMKQRGWIFSSARNLFKALWMAPGKYADEQIDLLLREAIYNPEVAQTIMEAASGKIGGKVFYDRVNTHLAAMAAYEADKSFGILLEEGQR